MAEAARVKIYFEQELAADKQIRRRVYD